MIDRKQRIALACASLAFFSVNTVAEVQTATLEKATLNIDTDTNDFTISALHDSGFQVTYLTDDNGTPYANLPSMALPEPALTDVTNKKANDVKMVKFDNSLIVYKEPNEYFYLVQETTRLNDLYVSLFIYL